VDHVEQATHHVEQATRDGYAGLRLVGDMAWAPRAPAGIRACGSPTPRPPHCSPDSRCAHLPACTYADATAQW
jgi:hypothetical protein